jgi:pimeloyl-ACP methyl ester carboxylesterase
LLSQHFTVYAYDRRGRGESGDTEPYSPQREVEDLAALINETEDSAFLLGLSSGDEPVVIHAGERLRWQNADTVEHDVVADTSSLPEFMTTGILAPGGERAFTMKTIGATRIHCTIHPQRVGMLVVQGR